MLIETCLLHFRLILKHSLFWSESCESRRAWNMQRQNIVHATNEFEAERNFLNLGLKLGALAPTLGSTLRLVQVSCL